MVRKGRRFESERGLPDRAEASVSGTVAAMRVPWPGSEAIMTRPPTAPSRSRMSANSVIEVCAAGPVLGGVLDRLEAAVVESGFDLRLESALYSFADVDLGS